MGEPLDVLGEGSAPRRSASGEVERRAGQECLATEGKRHGPGAKGLGESLHLQALRPACNLGRGVFPQDDLAEMDAGSGVDLVPRFGRDVAEP